MSTDQIFYNQDVVRVSAGITRRMSLDNGMPTTPHEAAAAAAQKAIDDMVSVGFVAPADLAAKTTARMDNIKSMIETRVAVIDEQLALVPEVQVAMGLDVATLQKEKASAEQFVAAMDEVLGGS